MQKVVLASGNKGKLKEMSEILAPYGFDIVPQSEFFSDEADETGLSFIENAILKARFAAEKSGLPAIADDSGIEVSALNGKPGIYSARYSEGEVQQVSDESNLQKLLTDMQDVADDKRQASYYCAMVYVAHAEDPTPIIGLGRWYGEILREKRGDGGFGYDPVFWVDEFGKASAELSKEQKNQVSHRAQALNALLMQLHRGA
ncbi:RdgB/HAM1 family non-canonical purine NTP pyrophosphatase [Thiomicrorhabdus sp. 6S2-11]|uniref:dITP/XTP pyrophosphatase n=1 Tax=Thiomicrorhabdus marina TaxID=2818442 RepID=A0ABS3Q4Q1_9GAMM|nr:RdgB/HAM1 family non-canonical purine NTP pyrophosphatase [Thiomicrorhabdus marina]MBO1927302.1 RdgB/HAM1 family non-canonical purine NTP pyrophosphatase [Thiomicrorhabdus marina]